MKNLFKLLIINLLSISAIAQNSITTPSGIPLIIGNNGVKMANLTSASTPVATNNKALSVDATGNIILVPDNVGGGDPNFRVLNTTNTISGVGAGQLLQNAGAGALGTSNLYLGNNAGYNSGLTLLSKENTFIGTNAGFDNTDGNNNAFLGIGAGRFNTLGNYNTFLGVNAGANNRTGSNNMILGTNAGYDFSGIAKNPSYSVFIGDNSGAKTSGVFNIFLGYSSGAHNITGQSNICIGGYAGGHPGVVNNNSCTFIGTQSGPWTGTDHANPTATFNNLTNATAIGNRAKCTISNALVLGGVDADAVKVGIGLTNPTYPLDLKGTFNLRVAYNSPTIKVNDHNFLELDEKGEYVLNSFKMKYSDVKQWSDKVFEKKYKLLTIKQLESYIQQKKHLPNVPSATEVVNNGVRQDGLNAKLLEKIEELSLYIIQLEKRISQVEKK
jgi:trimeric autotransporter adhesin